MKTTIDAAGRVVIPQRFRARLGLDGGAEVEIDERDGVVEIRPTTQQVRVVEDADGRLLFHAPEGTPPLTDDEVRQLVEETRLWPRA